MSRVGLLQLPSGLSGDMFLGALVDAGAPLEDMQEAVQRVAGSDVGFRAAETMRGGLRGIRVEVLVQGVVLHEPGGPGHETEKESHGHSHSHRAYREIVRLIEEAALPEKVRERALATFQALAMAEAKRHGTRPEDVHFHEVGGWDAIADVVGVAAGLESLQVEELYHGTVAVGGGTVTASHGTLPVPAPATLSLLQGRLLLFEEDAGELTTPTGAALLAALARPVPSGFRIVPERTGYGAGRWDPPGRPNLARLVIASLPAAEGLVRTTVCVVECALDDCSPEEASHVAARLFDEGALDVTLSPLLMKKGRPGFLLRAIGEAADAERLARATVQESTSLGARWRLEDRLELPRRIDRVTVEGHCVRVKVAQPPRGLERPHAEHDDLVALATDLGISLGEARRRVEAAWRPGK